MIENSVLYPVNNHLRHALTLDGMWKFQFDGKSIGLTENWASDGLPAPISMPVPASFADLFTTEKERDYSGDFWYETEFYTSADLEGRKLYVRFGSVTHRAKIFCNGKLVAEHEGGYLPIVADVTSAVNPEAANKLVVWANNELSSITLPCGNTAVLPDGRKVSVPSFDFFNYAGIHRSVWLVDVPAEAIEDYTLTYRLCGKDAEVDYSICSSGNGTVQVMLKDTAGNVVAEAAGATGTLHVTDAHLWQVRNAYLYTLVIHLYHGDTVTDAYSAKVGIRTVEVRGEEILINGSPVYLRGYGKHEDINILGKAFHWAVAKRDFELMKWQNANCFRTSHYPYAEEWYQMADEEGFLIIDEIAAVGMMRWAQSFVATKDGQSNSFFHFDKVDALKENHKKQLKELVERDKNHPSVICWSIFNEPEAVSQASYAYFADVFDYARGLDPQKRPLTGAVEIGAGPEKCSLTPLMDIICLNRYYGWYEKGGIEFDVGMMELVEELDGWKNKKLNKPFLFTEFGVDTLAAEHMIPPVMFTQEYQVKYYKAYFEIFDRYPFLQGELVWNFADFQTSQGVRRVIGNKKGIFTRDRQPKAAAFLLKDRWETV